MAIHPSGIDLITATAQPRAYWSADKALHAAAAPGSPPVRGEIQIRPAPWTLEVYGTMDCNVACTHCNADQRNHAYGLAEMPVEMMERLHASIAAMGVRGVQYCGGGEPLLWNGGRIADFIAALPRETTRAGMASNMTMGKALARPDVLDRMVFVETAVFAYDDASYEAVAHVKNGQSRMEKAVRAVLAARESAGLSTPAVNAKVIINSTNYRWLRQIYVWAENVGFDSIHLRLADDYERTDGDFVLDRRQRDEFRADLEAFGAERGLTEWVEKAALIVGDDNKGVVGDHTWCWTVATGVNCWVLANGEVYVCGPQWGSEQYLIGDLRHRDLEGIWGGEQHRQVARRLIANMGLTRCFAMGCRHIKQSMAVDAWTAGEVTPPAAEAFEQQHAWFL
ncbi:SPASM domain-containing protein [Streptomyces acidiscabies]|uniref:SPASM domain-containing protein n=1 Tax=Streptomyces acidiscabies TaxID=42234 RepID=UPI000962CE71|nr:SPASM domain-containing protein [Streptomyces acidiscabies]GAV38290.1 molybdenum cofactor biosynthesis protein A [Streptomyces acidiscabies]